MTMLRALVEHFVTPADDARPAVPAPGRASEPARTAAAPPAVGVLCGSRHASAGGIAVAHRLARRHVARAALVACWTGWESAPLGSPVVPPSREARRLASALRAHELAADAAGRVVVTALPLEQEIAAAAAARAFAVAAHVPTVLVLAGPRDEPLEELLRARDVVLVADDLGDAVADLALDALRCCGVAARPCALPTAPFTAAAARGALVLPAARRGLDLALEGVA